MLFRASRLGDWPQFGTMNGIASMSEPAKIILVMHWVGDRNYVGFATEVSGVLRAPNR